MKVNRSEYQAQAYIKQGLQNQARVKRAIKPERMKAQGINPLLAVMAIVFPFIVKGI